MALALPIWQSTLSFAFEKLSGRIINSTMRKAKAKTKKKRRSRTAGNAKFKDEEENLRTRNANIRYQSWVDSNGVLAEKDGQDMPTFGGWDEQDRTKSRMEYMKGSVRNTTGPRRTPLQWAS